MHPNWDRRRHRPIRGEQRLDEAFGLAIGTRRVRPSKNVFDPHDAATWRSDVIFSQAVVRHDLGDLHAQGLVVAQRRHQEGAGAPGGLVIEHQAEAP